MRQFTEQELTARARSFTKSATRGNLVFSEQQASLTVFLSHSHKDKELAEGFVDYLGTLGIKVYVDWKDTTMPAVTCRETAARIRKRIEVDDMFILLATNQSLASRWCPWELGIADQIKTNERILIVPVLPGDGRQYAGNEYCHLYKTIEKPSIVESVRVLNYADKMDSMAEYGFTGEDLGTYLKRFARPRPTGIVYVR